jgi:dihydroneopterin aldolase
LNEESKRAVENALQYLRIVTTVATIHVGNSVELIEMFLSVLCLCLRRKQETNANFKVRHPVGVSISQLNEPIQLHHHFLSVLFTALR